MRGGTHPAAERVETLGDRERGGGVGARSKEGLQLRIASDEGVRHRNGEARGAACRGWSKLLLGIVVREDELAVGADIVVDVVINRGIDVPAVERQDQVVVRLEVVGEEVRRKRGGDGRFRAGVANDIACRVTGNTGTEQRTIGVEAEAATAAVRGAETRSEDCVNSGLARRRGARVPGAIREDGSGAGRLSGEVASAFAKHFTGEVVHGEHSVTTAVSKVAAHGDARTPLDGVAVFHRGAVLAVDFNAFEIVAHDEVGHTGHSVSAVGRSCTAGDDFNALDECRRDRVDVDCATGEGGHATTAIDKHEVTARTQTAKVENGAAVGARVVRLGRQVRRDLRQRVQVLLNRGETRGDQRVLTNGEDRAFGNFVTAHKARTGDGDALLACFGFVALRSSGFNNRFICFLRNSHKRAGGSKQRTGKQRCGEQSLFPSRFVQLTLQK